MSFLNFIKNHIDDINNYVQPPIHWREGRFANPVAKAESTNGDFAEVVRSLPTELSREDVVGFFREDLYMGFVATIMWGGISRFRADDIARNNDRNTTLPKLERLNAILRNTETETDTESIEDAIFTLRKGGENNFYGIGPSFFTKLLYFLTYDMDINTRPLIFDENMKPVHFALMPEAGQDPFFYYVPSGNKINFAEHTTFDDVYYPYCELMCETAREVGVDVRNLEAWSFGWPANVNVQLPNPRVVAKTEVDRMQYAGILMFQCGVDNVEDAISASRIFYDNKIDVSELFISKDAGLLVGNDEEHPIVITETEGYVHLEYVIATFLFRLKRLQAKMLSQQFTSVGDKKLDRLCFEVKSAQDNKPRELDVFFDITAGFNAN